VAVDLDLSDSSPAQEESSSHRVVGAVERFLFCAGRGDTVEDFAYQPMPWPRPEAGQSQTAEVCSAVHPSPGPGRWARAARRSTDASEKEAGGGATSACPATPVRLRRGKTFPQPGGDTQWTPPLSLAPAPSSPSPASPPDDSLASPGQQGVVDTPRLAATHEVLSGAEEVLTPRAPPDHSPRFAVCGPRNGARRLLPLCSSTSQSDFEHDINNQLTDFNWAVSAQLLPGTARTVNGQRGCLVNLDVFGDGHCAFLPFAALQLRHRLEPCTAVSEPRERSGDSSSEQMSLATLLNMNGQSGHDAHARSQ
jgi:hypothetical protein